MLSIVLLHAYSTFYPKFTLHEIKQKAHGNRDLAVIDSQVLQFALHIPAALPGVGDLSLLTSVCGHPATLIAHADVHLFLDLNSA